MVNVHASGGRAMMAAARAAADEESSRLGRPRPTLIAVTLLTSIGDAELALLPFRGNAAEIAAELASEAFAAGLDGVVCSAADVARVRRVHGPGFVTVVPGIRPAGAESGDQKRFATPAAAIAAGASILVVGRPVTRASDPAAALEAIVAEIEGA